MYLLNFPPVVNVLIVIDEYMKRLEYYEKIQDRDSQIKTGEIKHDKIRLIRGLLCIKIG